MPYVITEACIGVKDRACVDVCPVDCIYEGEDQLYIHPDECIDCGACEPECPVSDLLRGRPSRPVEGLLQVNVEFFEELGSPGGASKVGKIDRDTRWSLPFTAGRVGRRKRIRVRPSLVRWPEECDDHAVAWPRLGKAAA